MVEADFLNKKLILPYFILGLSSVNNLKGGSHIISDAKHSVLIEQRKVDFLVIEVKYSNSSTNNDCFKLSIELQNLVNHLVNVSINFSVVLNFHYIKILLSLYPNFIHITSNLYPHFIQRLPIWFEFEVEILLFVISIICLSPIITKQCLQNLHT